MRRLVCVVALFVSLGLASPAWAQRTNGFHTTNSNNTMGKPIDTTKNLVAPVPTQPGRSALANLVPHFSLPSWLGGAQKPGPVLPSKSLPSARKSALKPVMPIPGR